MRTDVYSLGVLLYELLTGARPYAVTRDAFDPGVIARDIREGAVERPSQRAAAEDGAGQQRAAARGLTPRALAALLRGDMDWIVLRALEKDRQRRYASVGELAADLGRARDNEPVLAGPPSAMYVMGKFARRHRMGVAMAAGLFFAALLFGTGMGVLAHRAEAERDRANREAEVARRVTAFTAGLFAGADPAAAGDSQVSARQLLDAGVRRLETEFTGEREDVQAALLEAAANAYRGLGEYDKAGPLLTARSRCAVMPAAIRPARTAAQCTVRRCWRGRAATTSRPRTCCAVPSATCPQCRRNWRARATRASSWRRCCGCAAGCLKRSVSPRTCCRNAPRRGPRRRPAWPQH